MNKRTYLPLLSLLLLTCGARADQPTGAPVQVSVGAKVSVGGNDTYLKGWYLYWPDYALATPRLPIPYPYWPQQPAAIPPAPLLPSLPAPEQINTPPSPQPRSPGSTSWGPGLAGNPLQPVSYPVTVPSYWWQQR